ncbi:hypothetical protein [Streptomyces flavalbus]|uniref:Bacterial bifunctional deaminase-reductase C-terminal domain-containing protein n=1 Tax=Streptomyces flavalbus TaxID=2665155 RepID=A0ABW2WJP1_9ACTN
MHLVIAPMLIGRGERLFDNLGGRDRGLPRVGGGRLPERHARGAGPPPALTPIECRAWPESWTSTPVDCGTVRRRLSECC